MDALFNLEMPIMTKSQNVRPSRNQNLEDGVACAGGI